MWRFFNAVARPEIGNRQQGGTHPGWRLGGAFGEGPLVALRQALSSDSKYICGAGYAHMAQRLNYGSCRAARRDQMLGRGMAEIDHALAQNHAPGWPIRQPGALRLSLIHI